MPFKDLNISLYRGENDKDITIFSLMMILTLECTFLHTSAVIGSLMEIWLYAEHGSSMESCIPSEALFHDDDVIKWKHFPRYWPFVQGIHQSPVNSPHKGQWRGALMFSFICAWIDGWVNNRGVGDLRRHCAHYDVHLFNPGNRPGIVPLTLQCFVNGGQLTYLDASVSHNLCIHTRQSHSWKHLSYRGHVDNAQTHSGLFN